MYLYVCIIIAIYMLVLFHPVKVNVTIRNTVTRPSEYPSLHDGSAVTSTPEK